MRQHKTVPVKFPNRNGDLLAGRLELPTDREATHFGLFMHCFTCSKEFFAPSKTCKALADRGIAMLRFDFTGLGESGGSFSDSTFSTSLGDVLSAADFLRRQYQAPALLVGHSMGGAAALAATRELGGGIKAVATIGSPRDPAHVLRHFEDHQQLLETDGKVELVVAGRQYFLKKDFFSDMASHDVAQDTRDFGGAVFVFHAPEDDMVYFSDAKVIYDRASGPRFLISMDGATHMLDKPEDAALVADVLSGWLQEGQEPLQKTA